MVASSNHEQYTPFPRVTPFEPEGFQSSASEAESEILSPVFDQPRTAFLPMDCRYQSIASDFLLPHDGLIAPPHSSQYYVQSQGFGAHHHGYPKEPPNTAISYNASVQLRTQSFTSSAYELAMANCSPLLMNSATNRFSTSIDIPPSVPHTTPSHFHLSHPPTIASVLPPQPPLGSPVDAVDPPTSATPVASTDLSITSSSRAGPSRSLSSGVIACQQCRSRKIRCDSTRPKCQNCNKRGNDCVYDKVPKRRGPDKRPGTRKRSCKKRQSDGSEPQPKKKRRADPVDQDAVAHAGFNQYEITPVALQMFGPAQHRAVGKVDTELPAASSSLADATSTFHHQDYYVKRPPSPTSIQPASTSHSLRSEFPPEPPFNRPFEDIVIWSPSPPLANIPVTDYPRKEWWDDLLDAYSQHMSKRGLEDIRNDLNILFSSSNHWLTFFNIHSFLRDLFDPHARTHIQPALVYACLAMAMLMKSSEIELGASGRAHALRLRDTAQAHLRQSWDVQQVDLGLAEAAMVLALFETSAHPEHDDANADTALLWLDKIIQVLRLTDLDARDPDTLDHSTGVPTVAHPHPLPNSDHLVVSTAWDPSWDAAEMKAEETRRLCWSALILVANHTVVRAAEHREPLDLFLVNSSNFHLLFPGEYHRHREYVSHSSGKDTVWALYCRSMLLWNCTVRFWDESLSTEERTRIACAAFVETHVLEDALDAHICNIDTALIYMCREFISNTRLEVTYLTRSILLDLDVRTKPVWNRRLAEEWLFYQEQIAKRVKNSLTRITEPSAHIVLRRPFHVGWFTNQVATCLALWDGDRELLRALELAKTFLAPTEVLNSLWPCQAFHSRGKELRAQLSQACVSAGIPPPLPQSPDLAPFYPATRVLTSRP
ncbi:hypothetical protein BGW80DRAFT_1335542 [Lactifluus volemus]|nr:hypothetical protein BGW80DRAFT_1335542 [Lactifluus volemus]